MKFITAAIAKRDGGRGLFESAGIVREGEGWSLWLTYKPNVAGPERSVVIRNAYLPAGTDPAPRVFKTIDAAVRNVQEIIGEAMQLQMTVDWKARADLPQKQKSPA